MRSLALASTAFVFAAAAHGQAAPLKPPLDSLSFLVGTWSGGGTVSDTGGTSKGSSTIDAEAGGAVLMCRDHTSLFDPAGRPAGGFDQIMMIYPDDGTIHADYVDGTHVIHYKRATIEPGRSVTFDTDASPGGPAFRLSYRVRQPDSLALSFSMAPPGAPPGAPPDGGTYRPIAVGTLQRVR